MKFIELTCRNCGATLEVDVDRLQAYCPYCGKKLLFDLDQMETVLSEKERTKRAVEATKQAQEKTERIRLQNEYRAKQREDESKKDRANAAINISDNITMIILVLAGFGFLILELQMLLVLLRFPYFFTFFRKKSLQTDRHYATIIPHSAWLRTLCLCPFLKNGLAEGRKQPEVQTKFLEENKLWQVSYP